jgi:hypothetical protein
MHAAQAGKEALAEFLPTRAGADQPSAIEWRHIQSAVPGDGHEQYIAQDRFQLTPRERAALAEW